jgi:hypothetical protein
MNKKESDDLKRAIKEVSREALKSREKSTELLIELGVLTKKRTIARAYQTKPIYKPR